MRRQKSHESYNELDLMADKFSDICNDSGVGTHFLTPETGVWYGYWKDENGTVKVCRVNDKA